MQSMKWHSTSKSEIERARKLRGDMTEVERPLWLQLRAEQVAGYRFRRQVPIGDYVVDFACMKAKLVVELDGGQHAAAVKSDSRRTQWLESQGFRVLRFWNNAIVEELEGVLETIHAALLKPPRHPAP